MSSIKGKIKTTLKQSQGKARDLARSATESVEGNLERLLNKRITLGVTGFSGSGKTTLITSLIHQLQHFSEAQLAAFPPAIQERLLGVQMSSLNGLPLFPYQQGIEALTKGGWPEATRQESGCVLEIKYLARPGLLKRRKPEIGRLLLELRDYPGEWLLDLPMLEMDYQTWSRQCFSLLDDGIRKSLASELIAKLHEIDPLQPIASATLQCIWQTYVTYLQQCQQAGFSMIQPGRWLHLTPEETEQTLPFIPLPALHSLSAEQIASAPDDALVKVCERHYQNYQKNSIKPFYRHTFQKVDRQLVLIDAVRTLSSGQPVFDDLRYALAQALQSFDYGHNGFLTRLISPKIDRVVFAATKIDQVLSDQHEAIRSLTANLVQDAKRRATFNAIDMRCEAVAAVRSSTCVEYQGRQALQGITNDGPGMLLHPEIPEKLPEPDDWEAMKSWKLRRLLPPQGMQLTAGGRLPHIRLDSILNDLLGDRF
ncbi:YcjX family protein [uncultured Endozoicomonas sp.]|uniref:YcjX family protein n=1 Tax=uncultured Endozoicomonas sp. TaxID=432652 RepID=UPI002639647E|nr:YcjX family protein [uncultured Endozoicomonas sp.]